MEVLVPVRVPDMTQCTHGMLTFHTHFFTYGETCHLVGRVRPGLAWNGKSEKQDSRNLQSLSDYVSVCLSVVCLCLGLSVRPSICLSCVVLKLFAIAHARSTQRLKWATVHTLKSDKGKNIDLFVSSSVCLSCCLSLCLDDC